MKSMTEEESLTSIDKSFYVLESLCNSDSNGISLKNLSRELGFNKSTTHRILNTLKSHGFARQEEESRKYQPGLRIVELGEQVLEGIDIRKEAHQELSRLSDKVNEVVHLGIIEGEEVVYLDKFNPPERPFQIYSSVGKSAPIHCTGLGKAILAFLPESRRERLIEKQELQRFTPQTITSPSKLSEELEDIRKSGFSVDNKEHEEEVRCIGVPIRDHGDKVRAAISVTVPSFRMNLQELKEYVPEAKETAREISSKLRHDTRSL